MNVNVMRQEPRAQKESRASEIHLSVPPVLSCPCRGGGQWHHEGPNRKEVGGRGEEGEKPPARSWRKRRTLPNPGRKQLTGAFGLVASRLEG